MTPRPEPLAVRLAKLAALVVTCGVLGAVLAHDEELARLRRSHGYQSQRLYALEVDRMHREHPELFVHPDQGGPHP